MGASFSATGALAGPSASAAADLPALHCLCPPPCVAPAPFLRRTLLLGWSRPLSARAPQAKASPTCHPGALCQPPPRSSPGANGRSAGLGRKGKRGPSRGREPPPPVSRSRSGTAASQYDGAPTQHRILPPPCPLLLGTGALSPASCYCCRCFWSLLRPLCAPPQIESSELWPLPSSAAPGTDSSRPATSSPSHPSLADAAEVRAPAAKQTPFPATMHIKGAEAKLRGLKRSPLPPPLPSSLWFFQAEDDIVYYSDGEDPSEQPADSSASGPEDFVIVDPPEDIADDANEGDEPGVGAREDDQLGLGPEAEDAGAEVRRTRLLSAAAVPRCSSTAPPPPAAAASAAAAPPSPEISSPF